MLRGFYKCWGTAPQHLVIGGPQYVRYIRCEPLAACAPNNCGTAGARITYFLMQATSSFRVDRQDGAVVVASSLDYEASPNYTLAVMASDCPTNGPALVTYATVVVHVLDVNDNPPWTLDLRPLSVPCEVHRAVQYRHSSLFMASFTIFYR